MLLFSPNTCKKTELKNYELSLEGWMNCIHWHRQAQVTHIIFAIPVTNDSIPDSKYLSLKQLLHCIL